MEEPDGCRFWAVGPVEISPNNYLGNITIYDVVNISLELKTPYNWTCPMNAYCNVLGIGLKGAGAPDLPSLALRRNTNGKPKILWVTTTNEGETKQLSFGNQQFQTTFNDGTWCTNPSVLSQFEELFV